MKPCCDANKLLLNLPSIIIRRLTFREGTWLKTTSPRPPDLFRSALSLHNSNPMPHNLFDLNNYFLPQINELSHVNIPVMLLPDDFRAYSKLKVDNHLFNK